MNKAILSAPFGSYLSIPGVTSTRGTYTSDRRLGAIYGALTRINFTHKGVYNKMGLRNPGIRSQNVAKHPDVIWSIAGLDYPSWLKVIFSLPVNVDVELNVSCPNAKQAMFPSDLKAIFHKAASRFNNVIVKLPADFNRATRLYDWASNEGINHYHCCNTIKTDKGGLSGRAIQKYSLPIITHIKRDTGVVAIAGGGNYDAEDIKRYRDAGADRFALGTICFMPWKIPGVLDEINK